MKKFLPLTLIVFLTGLLLPGCNSVHNASDLKRMHTGSSDRGVVVLSIMRANKKEAVLLADHKVMNFDVYAIGEDGSIEEDPIFSEVTSARTLLIDPQTPIFESRYGELHSCYLPAGRYIMMITKPVLTNMGLLQVTEHKVLPKSFVFEVRPNVINYIGEYLVLCDEITDPECVVVNDEMERDMDYEMERRPDFEGLETVPALGNATPLEKRYRRR